MSVPPSWIPLRSLEIVGTTVLTKLARSCYLVNMRTPDFPSDEPRRRSDGEATHAAIVEAAVRLASIEGLNSLTIGRPAGDPQQPRPRPGPMSGMARGQAIGPAFSDPEATTPHQRQRQRRQYPAALRRTALQLPLLTHGC